MAKFKVPRGQVCQAYRFEVDRPSRHPEISSHEGARRYAWNWGLGLIEDQLHARSAYRVLALRQGATAGEADAWAKTMVPVPWSMPALRRIWNQEKHEVAPWWSENSKECYSSAFEGLSAAFKNYFDSRSGTRHGSRVAWPRRKGRGGRQTVSFTTGGIAVVDRHHVRLPVIGNLRVKEPTDKLGLRLDAGTARNLRATMSSEGSKTFVSFSVLVQRDQTARELTGVCGHDVGISSLVTGSDGHVVENERPAAKIRPAIRRYQRRMDRQHRTGSPRCFNPDGTHIKGACYWNKHTRSLRSAKNQHRLARAHAKASNIRKDPIHKASHRAATTYAINVVEDLNVDGMGRRGRGKRRFNDASHDAALAELRRQLTYKCPWSGSAFWVASRWYPSSKICSRCQAKKANLSRSARVFHCDVCGLDIDRDLNAAKNLAALAELACVCLMARLMTGQPVDWSTLPVRPAGWEKDQDTRSSRGCARAGGRKANGGERKTAQARTAGDCSFDREAAVATGSVISLGGASSSPKKVVA